MIPLLKEEKFYHRIITEIRSNGTYQGEDQRRRIEFWSMKNEIHLGSYIPWIVDGSDMRLTYFPILTLVLSGSSQI